MTGYDLKYQSDFYNIFHKLVSVKIYKKNYGVHDLILIRTSEVTIEVNFQGENTPIVGTGAKVNIVNEKEFTYLEDLLKSQEKQFFCTIEYNGVVVFQGFSLCDLNEQQFLQYARITLQFVNYFRRLEDNYSGVLTDIGDNAPVLGIIRNALVSILGVADAIPLHVNSTLFETTMSAGSADTVFEQTFIEVNAVYTSPAEYEDTYKVINKMLLSMGAFLYAYGTKWMIERQEDVMRAGNWVLYPNLVDSIIDGEPIGSLRQEYNKQAGNFKYVDTSQLVEYQSGLQKLVLDLKDKQLDSFVFNNYSISMLTVSDETPDAGTLSFRKWYRYVDIIPLVKGYVFRGMDIYFKWTYPISVTSPNHKDMGLYYNFQVTFNISEDVPTELSVSFKMSGENNLIYAQTAYLRFLIRIDGGPLSDYYLTFWTPPDMDSPIPSLTQALSLAWVMESFDTRTDKKTRTWTMSTLFNLSDSFKGTQNNYPSIWNLLGNPSSQRFTIMIYPIMYENITSGFDYERINYIGDVAVTITQHEILNKLTYYVNEDFIKTETIDIDFFDLENRNFCNGFLTGALGANKTKLWTSEQSPDQQSLMDILARDRFRRYCRTIHKLKGSIIHDGYMKPFSVLTDNNLQLDSEYGIKLLLESYVWDLNNGVYDVEAVEYTEEDILMDLSKEIPIVPVGLSAYQISPGAGIYVSWAAVTGATSYILQRKPYNYYEGTGWTDYFITIYDGAGLAFTDSIQDEGTLEAPLEDNTMVSYKLLAYNANGQSLSSAIVTVQWYEA